MYSHRRRSSADRAERRGYMWCECEGTWTCGNTEMYSNEKKKRSSTDKKCSYVLEQDKLFVRTGRRWKLRGNKRRKELWGAKGERGGLKLHLKLFTFLGSTGPLTRRRRRNWFSCSFKPQAFKSFFGAWFMPRHIYFLSCIASSSASRYIKTFYLRCQLFSFTSTAHISQFPPTHICQ